MSSWVRTQQGSPPRSNHVHRSISERRDPLSPVREIICLACGAAWKAAADTASSWYTDVFPKERG